MEAVYSFFFEYVDNLTHFWPLLTVIGGILSAVLAGAVIPILQDDKSFKQIRDWAFKPRIVTRYRDLISAGLTAAGRFYGPTLRLSWRGYLTCLLVSLVYTLFLWQVAWCLEGPVKLAGLSGFDDTIAGYLRWLSLIVFWTTLLVLGIVWGKLPRISEYLTQHIAGAIHRRGFIRPNAEILMRAVAAVASVAGGVAVCIVVAVVVVFTVRAVGAVGIVLVISIVVAVRTVGVVGAVGAVVAVGVVGEVVAVVSVVIVGTVVAIGVVGALVLVLRISEGASVVYITIALIIPFANAVLDHISVQVSRWLLSDLVARSNSVWQRLMVIGHITVDMIAAVLFLTILAVLLPVVLQLANHAFIALDWPLVEWGTYLDAARREPFGAGIMVTGMLATTLIPTILHLLAAVGALALPHIAGHRIRALADKAELTLLDRMSFVLLIALSVCISWAVLVVASVALWQSVEFFIGPFGGHLADIAENVGRTIGGPGAPGS